MRGKTANLPAFPLSDPVKGHLAAFFTIFVWGTTFINTKLLLEAFSPVEIMFFRFVLAVGVLCLFSPPHPNLSRPVLQVLKAEWKLMVAGLCGVTLYFLCQNIALSYTLAANVGVLVSVAPLFTALASWAILKEPLKPYFFLGFAAAIAGIILIAFNGSLVLKLNPAGDLLSVLAALVWAFYSVTIKKIGADESNPFRVTRQVFIYGLLFLLPVMVIFPVSLHIERLLVLSNLLNLVFLGVVASALCFFSWNYAVHTLGPVKTSVYIYMDPLVTIGCSALVLGETITLVAGIGIVLILAGMLISERGK